MNRITKHVYTNLIDGVSINDQQMNIDNSYTLQGSLDIPMGISSENHKLNVLVVGSGPMDDNGVPIVNYETNPLNTTLFNHIPFFAIKESDEIGPRPQYRLRKLVIKNNVRYIVYYGLSIEPTIVDNRLLLLKDDDGYITSEFDPIVYNVRTPRYYTEYKYKDNEFVVYELTLSVILTPTILRAMYNANLLINDTDLDIRELGMCASADGIMHIGNVPNGIPEAKDCILAYTIKHNIKLTSDDVTREILTKDFRFELGGMELTQIDMPIKIL